MKRIIAMILVMSCILLSINCLAEETAFTFHKGLYFGMTKDNVVDFETKTNNTDFDCSIRVKLDDALIARTTFANEEAEMYFSFSDTDKLTSVVFFNQMVLSTDGYYKNIEVFNSKYGEQISPSDKSYMQLPVKGYDAAKFYGSKGFFYYWQKSKHYSLNVENTAEYRIETTDGYYDIETILLSYIFMGYTCYGIITSYAYIDKQDYLDMIANETMQNQEAEQNRNDDL